MKGAKFKKTMVFLPYIINGVAIAYAFSYFYSPFNGAFNSILELLKLELWIRSWLSDPQIVIYVASDLMQLYIYLEFISRIPVPLDEAALIDGCSYFKLFGQIIFPLLAPTKATVCIIKSIIIINDMYIPYLYMPKNSLRTLTMYLMNFPTHNKDLGKFL